MTIKLFLDPERATFISARQGIDFSATIIATNLPEYGHTEIDITFPNWMSFDLICLQMFHLGIKFQSLTNSPLYKPNQYKVNDIMGMAHD
jgi:hypothetical protein